MATHRKTGFFRTALRELVAARQRQADRYVAGTLLMLDDESLKARGYSRDELSKQARAHPI